MAEKYAHLLRDRSASFIRYHFGLAEGGCPGCGTKDRENHRDKCGYIAWLREGGE